VVKSPSTPLPQSFHEPDRTTFGKSRKGLENISGREALRMRTPCARTRRPCRAREKSGSTSERKKRGAAKLCKGRNPVRKGCRRKRKGETNTQTGEKKGFRENEMQKYSNNSEIPIKQTSAEVEDEKWLTDWRMDQPCESAVQKKSTGRKRIMWDWQKGRSSCSSL